MITDNVYIYKLVTSNDMRAFYVGQSIEPRVRLIAHWNEQTGSDKYLFMHQQYERGYDVLVIVLEIVEKTRANEVERFWIDQLSKTENLLNDLLPNKRRNYQKLNAVWTQVKIKTETVEIIRDRLLSEGDKLQYVVDDLIRLALKVKKIELQ